MYGKLNAILRSKMALWGIAVFAIVMFCITATLAFGLHANKKAASTPPVGKLPSVQPQMNGLQVKNSSGDASPAHLQGQDGNASVSQPAAPASTAPESAGLGNGLSAVQVQAGAGTTVGPASTSLSGSLQPSADLDGDGGANVQAGLNALGAGVNLNTKLP